MWWIAAAAALAAAYAFLNFWAAIDLGYDVTLEGKRIIERWGYVVSGSVVVASVCSVLAIRARRRGAYTDRR
jgi:hypothetical protein